MKSGLGIRPELFGSVENDKPDFGFLEAHSENYFGESVGRAKLIELREHYPISLHGVGLSLGRADALDKTHLTELSRLVNDIDPFLVSEHLAWSAYSHRHLPDLLPLPLTEEALSIMCEHIDEMQNALGRQVLVENPSNYLLFDQLQIPEPEFLNELAKQTGCGLLIDVNNIHVSASNVGRDSTQYLNSLNSEAIAQYHLAGYTEVEHEIDGAVESVLIDTHNQTVYEPVWKLFEHALQQHGVKPSLFEWDSDFPDFDILKTECLKANKLLDQYADSTGSIEPVKTATMSTNGSLANHQASFLDNVMQLEPKLTGATDAHQHRLWIYQNNVFGAIQDYLIEVFPATSGVVGEGFFKQMVQAYIQTSPPSEGNIHLYGNTFGDVVNTFEGLNNLPYLGDLITYEWALHNAYFSPLASLIDPNAISQQDLLTLPVGFNQSVSIINSDYPIFEIHRQSLPDYDGEVVIELSQSQDKLVVYKNHYSVECKELSTETFAALSEIQKSENLLQAIEVLQGSISEENLAKTLTLIFDLRLLADTQVPPSQTLH